MNLRRATYWVLAICLVVVGGGLAGYIDWQQSIRSKPTVISGDTWHNTGPRDIAENAVGSSSGRILSVAVAAGTDSTPGTIYIGSADGGIWKSTDGGEKWMPLTDHQLSLAVSSLVVDPRNPLTVYAGTGGLRNSYRDAFFGDGILKTTDGGKHWNTVGIKTFGHHTIQSLVINPVNPHVLYAADTDGIYESTDSGQTWHLNWSAELHERVLSMSIDPSNPSVLYATGKNIPLIVSADAGKTWHEVNLQGLPSNAPVASGYVAVAPSNSQIVYTFLVSPSLSQSGLWVSHDGGKSWIRRKLSSSIFSAAETPAFGALGVDPQNPEHVFIGAQFLAESTNGGKSWNPLLPSIHADDHAIVFDEQGNTYFGTDGGIWEDSKGGEVSDLNANLSITQFYEGMSVSKDSNIILGGTQDNGTLELIPRLGTQWSYVKDGDGGYTATDPSRPHAFYLQNIGLHQVYLKDIGSGNIRVTPPYPSPDELWNVPIATLPSAPDSVLVGGQKIYLSTNQGTNWRSIFKGYIGRIRITALTWSNKNVIYAGTSSGQVLATKDGGEHWTTLNLPTDRDRPASVMSISVVPGHGNAVVVTLGEENRQLYHYPKFHADVFYTADISVDANKPSAWHNVTGNLPWSPVESSLIHDGSLYVGTDQGVFETSLSTLASPHTTWFMLHKGLPNTPVVSMVLLHSSLYAATHGRGVWETKLDASPKS